MKTSSVPTIRPRPALMGLALTITFVAALPACRTPPTQIVLVVETNLSKVDLDDVKIAVSAVAGPVDGASPDLDAGDRPPFDVALGTPGAPTFPLTLGIEPSGSPGSVAISVQGLLAGNVVVQQSAVTSFVPGQQKMLLILLLDSCVGTTCPNGATPQTCSAGKCDSAAIDPSRLVNWTGAPPPRPAPSPAAPIGGRTIWSNGWHSCANEASVLYCWGQNSDGEIGDGTTHNANARRPVTGISDPAAVGLGQLTSCACDRAGNAWCWGRNIEGELGIGSASTNSVKPIQVPGIDDCVQIAGGALHTCVVHGRDGSVSCWGGNALGQVGQPASAGTSCAVSGGTAVPCVTSPMLVPGLANVAEVHGGEQYTCARKNDLTVWCWGDNSNGTLGDGTNTSRSTPSAVATLDKDVMEIATGRWFACARHAAGTVSCWGANGSGQLGNGTMTNSNRPVAVTGITDARQVGGGQIHACVLHASNTVSCWGATRTGSLETGR